MTSVSMPVSFGTTGPASFSSSRSTSPSNPSKTKTAGKTIKTKAKAGQPNSDHRREQNRIASKNYREKRKKKLALLRQILDEPADSASSADADGCITGGIDAGETCAAPIVPTSGSLSTELPPATLSAVFSGFNSDFQPDMLTDLLSTGADSLAVPPQPSQVAPPPQPATRTTAAASAATSSSTWTAATSASHLSNPFSWMLPGPLPATPTATTTTSGSASVPAAAGFNAPSMPLNSWTAPFAGGLASGFPAASSSTTPPTSLPSLSSITPPSSSTPSDTFDHADTLGSAFGLDATLDLDQMMQSDLSAASFFADMPMPDTTFARPSQPSQPAQQPLPPHQPLPSRPSPRVLLASLAPPVHANPTAASVLPGPSRRTRKKNKPVVRAMLQYVQTLSSHQRRLILQALLDEGEGGGTGRGVGADERVEEVDEFDDDNMEDDDADADDDEHSPRSHGTSSTAPSSADAGTTAVQTLRHQRHREVARRWNATTRDEALAAAAAAYTNISISALGDEYDTLGTGFGSASLRGRAHLPPTYMTMTLQCRRVAFCAAILQNCAACGLPNPAAMLEESSCGSVDSDGNSVGELQSPFALTADDARAVAVQGPARIAAVVAAVRQSLAASGKTPPRDLQPVDAQILVAHHPYMDTIPFRGFRARALALLAEMEAAEEVAAAAHQAANLLYSSTAGSGAGGSPGQNADTPCLLDEDELCYDMNVADGLICWGSQIGNGGTGVSAQAMRDSATSRDMRAGVPWDMRSWEPQVWFLKKYWYLVGGWDDDMWRSCRWWHTMRGEDLDYSVFTAPEY